MARALSVRVEQTYVPLSDRELPPEQQTRFTARPPTGIDKIKWRAYARDLGAGPESAGALVIEWLVRHLLTGWENFPGHDDKLVEFVRGKHMERLDDALVYELGNWLLSLKDLSEDDSGKSDLPSSSRSGDPPPAPSAEQ